MRIVKKDARFLGGLRAAVLAIAAGPVLLASNLAAGAQTAPKPGHVFIIVLENEGYNKTFGPGSKASYLNQLAQQKGALLQNYYGIGHYSLDNYIAMVSGQAPNPVTQADCQKYVDFQAKGTAEYDQTIGNGCVYPAGIPTIVNQLATKQLSWKGYMEDMGNDPRRENAGCGQPVKFDAGWSDGTQTAEKRDQLVDQYASRHNPFVYFHSIVDDAAGCSAHIVNLAALKTDLNDETTTPNYVFITPNLCNDGHDGGDGHSCVNGDPGGLVSADKFLSDTVPGILESPAFKHDGLLIITFDESDIDIDFDPWTGKLKFEGDASACCNEQPGPNIRRGATVFGVPDHGPGVVGPGGGRIGAVLVSPFIKPGTVSKIPYNHYSMLRSIEDFFAVEHLGYAAQNGLTSFGKDVFNKPNE
jgi:phosphatidylinositol-3-phosphatase